MTHLSDEQIARWAAGERDADAELHVAACRECREQVAEFAGVLAEFGGQAKMLPVPPPSERSRRPAMLSRALAIAAALILLLIPVYRGEEARRRALRDEQDAQLLRQVDAEISRPVADAMAPLVQMVKWNSNEAQK